MSDRHQFALFIDNLSQAVLEISNSVFSVQNKELLHRICTVLRLKPQDELILFDREVHAQAVITQIQKKEISFSIRALKQNPLFAPTIVVGLALLKKDALYQAIYGLVEVGVSRIQLLTTHKAQQWYGEKEMARIDRIVIAAAEQSKNYRFPKVIEPTTLEKFITESEQQERNKLFFFDVGGKPIAQLVTDFQFDQYTMIIGPEGDLTSNEKAYLKEKLLDFYSLTPTVLRAQQAAIVGAGLCRSFFYKQK